jgi:nucleoid-associated protein YgaU
MIYPPNSRYFTSAVTSQELPDGTTVVYLKRRFIPPVERFVALQQHAVVEGDRLDNLAARYLGDPEQYWRICDANRAQNPEQLLVVGERIAITLPEGIPGAPLV